MMRCWPDKGDHPTTAITSDGTPHPLLGPGPVVVHMFIIPPRDAILDLPFREPKDLSTPLPSPSAPRRRSSPSSRRAHEYRGPQMNAGSSVRASSARPRERRASMGPLDHVALMAGSSPVSASIAAHA